METNKTAVILTKQSWKTKAKKLKFDEMYEFTFSYQENISEKAHFSPEEFFWRLMHRKHKQQNFIRISFNLEIWTLECNVIWNDAIKSYEFPRLIKKAGQGSFSVFATEAGPRRASAFKATITPWCARNNALILMAHDASEKLSHRGCPTDHRTSSFRCQILRNGTRRALELYVVIQAVGQGHEFWLFGV